MYVIRAGRSFFEFGKLFLLVFLIVSILMRPIVTAQSVLGALTVCIQNVVPSVFPFLILTQLILENRYFILLGFPLSPLVRAMGIQNKKAATVLLMGFLGGFASGAAATNSLYQQREISKREAETLICAAVNAGPGFLIGAIGIGMLGSPASGWYLLAATTCASIATGIVMNIVMKRKAQTQTDWQQETTPHSAQGFVGILRNSVNATLMLCGCVAFFMFITEISVAITGNTDFAYWISLPLESTTACLYASKLAGQNQLMLCCAAVSLMGFSIYFQVRSLLPSEVSTLPFAFSRILHMPLSLLFLHLLLFFIPIHASAAAFGAYDVRLKMPADCIVIVFFMLCILFRAVPAQKYLRNSKNIV